MTGKDDVRCQRTQRGGESRGSDESKSRLRVGICQIKSRGQPDFNTEGTVDSQCAAKSESCFKGISFALKEEPQSCARIEVEFFQPRNRCPMGRLIDIANTEQAIIDGQRVIGASACFNAPRDNAVVTDGHCHIPCKSGGINDIFGIHGAAVKIDGGIVIAVPAFQFDRSHLA